MIASAAIEFGIRELTFCVVFVVAVLYTSSFRKYLNYWKNQNVPYEKLDFFHGSLTRMTREPFHEIDMSRVKKYGKVFGTFEGPKPTLIVADPDLVKLVLVKHFQELPDRRHVKFHDPILDNMMTMLPLERWRKIRPAASPAFTTGKLRKMNSIIQDCARVATQCLLKVAESGNDIKPKVVFGHYTLDVITRCVFSARIPSHSKEADEFVAKLLAAFNLVKPTLPVILFFYTWILFPCIQLLLKIRIFKPDTFLFLKDFCLNVIKERKLAAVTHHDFLQLMIDAQNFTAQSGADRPQDTEEKLYNLGNEEAAAAPASVKALTEEEALSQCVAFFIAGQDATSSVLAYTFYLLALHPEVQLRLQEEVDRCFEENGEEPSLDDIYKLKYLNCVISESLRLYPPAVRYERTACQDLVLGDTGIKLSKGCVVGIPVYAMHHSPEYFPDPEKFDPDRFSDKNIGSIRPYSFLPFGAGPRNCIGMRFALQALKTCLLHVVHSVELVRTENTKVPLKMVTSFGLLTAEDITIGVRKRATS